MSAFYGWEARVEERHQVKCGMGAGSPSLRHPIYECQEKSY